MADDKSKAKGKPKDSKPSSSSSSESPWIYIFGIIIAIGLIWELVSLLLVAFGFKDKDTGAINTHAVDTFKISFTGYISTFQAISIFITVLFFVGIIFIKFRVYEMKRMEIVKKKVSEISSKKISERPEPNKKWLKVEEHIKSPNPSDWRLAILEADILLNEILEKMGYHGMTIGDKLKTVERSDFTNLDAAWEAHKTRNLIAHEGSNFEMNQREAQRVISLYEKVFKEFYFI